MKHILLIASHYPPMRGSSGVQRTLQFSRYLPGLGWRPDVLTLSPRAHPITGPEELGEIPQEAIVKRAFALDAARHLSIRGRYPSFLAWPDRWSTWLLSAIPSGLRMISRRKIDVIWSTYPIATAHLVGLGLARITGLPWVADCRDSMVDDTFPSDPATRNAHRWIEQRVASAATRVVFTTNGTRELYQHRYPDVPKDRWAVIENGFDERSFSGLTPRPHGQGPFHLIHSGLIYPAERDPREMLKAIGLLKQHQPLLKNKLRVTLRATGHDEYIRECMEGYDIGDIITLAPGIAYRDALQEMLDADGLLLLQGSTCNHQIPAKAYEYLRAQRPIMALTDKAGDTAKMLADNGIDTVASLDSNREILALLQRFLDTPRESLPTPDPTVVSRHTREQRTVQLASLLQSVCF